MKKHIPNVVTCFNLLCGCVGVVMAFQGELIYAGYATVAAAVFDFFDGLIARWLNTYSEIGKDLDSLADVISFGVLPSSIVYQLFLEAPQLGELSYYLNFSAFLIAMFSALRLAKFNTDVRQSENFIGLPTPANALLIASLPQIILGSGTFLSAYILNPFFLFLFCLGSGMMLVMEVPLISLKFKNFDIKENLPRYILLVSGLIFILFFKFAAIPIIIFTYIILSIIQFRIIR